MDANERELVKIEMIIGVISRVFAVKKEIVLCELPPSPRL